VYTEALRLQIPDALLVTTVRAVDKSQILTDTHMMWPLPESMPYRKVMSGSLMEQNGYEFQFNAWARMGDSVSVEPPSLIAPRFEYHAPEEAARV
jgi:hypothetical protein